MQTTEEKTNECGGKTNFSSILIGNQRRGKDGWRWIDRGEIRTLDLPFSALRTLSVSVLCGPLQVLTTSEHGTEDTRKQGGRIVDSA